MAESRASILKRFRQKVASGRAIVGGGAGTGLSAKCEEAGGIDLIVIYNSGRYRMAGRGSLSGYSPACSHPIRSVRCRCCCKISNGTVSRAFKTFQPCA